MWMGCVTPNRTGTHLAYRVVDGDEDRDIVLITPGGTIPMDYLHQRSDWRSALDGLSAIGRLVLFDRIGVGLSDPITDWSRPLVEPWADDLDLIAKTACRRAPVVVGLGDYGGPARLFAGRKTSALSALVLYEPTGPAGGVDLSQVRTSEDLLSAVCPRQSSDPARRRPRGSEAARVVAICRPGPSAWWAGSNRRGEEWNRSPPGQRAPPTCVRQLYGRHPLASANVRAIGPVSQSRRPAFGW